MIHSPLSLASVPAIAGCFQGKPDMPTVLSVGGDQELTYLIIC